MWWFVIPPSFIICSLGGTADHQNLPNNWREVLQGWAGGKRTVKAGRGPGAAVRVGSRETSGCLPALWWSVDTRQGRPRGLEIISCCQLSSSPQSNALCPVVYCCPSPCVGGLYLTENPACISSCLLSLRSLKTNCCLLRLYLSWLTLKMKTTLSLIPSCKGYNGYSLAS